MKDAYYVVYDMNDNIITYLNDKKELCSFTGMFNRHVNTRFKNKKFIYRYIGNKVYKIYKFI